MKGDPDDTVNSAGSFPGTLHATPAGAGRSLRHGAFRFPKIGVPSDR